jgi:lipopolysaccharide transport system ATP-binding protein
MSKPVIKVENMSKQYRLGLVGADTLSDDLKRWWYRLRGKEDPFALIGDTNDRASAGESDYVWALKDINFEVQQGEVLGIIGKNGAGKSTLLKLLSKVTGPTTGSIKAKGRIASLLEVGTGFHPELTGRENIYLNGTILGMTKKEVDSKIDEIIDFAGVERYVDTPVKRYSSGMRVRLGFAVAAHLDPEILIIDEVLAVGDAEFQKKAVGKMQEVSGKGGRTVLFVSHNMASVKALCTRCIVLKDGMIGFEGDTLDAVHYYQTTGVQPTIGQITGMLMRLPVMKI